VPDVIIGGAPRSGTTFLCELLAKHPDIYVAKPFIPEPKVCMTPHPGGDAGLLRRYADIFSDAPSRSIRIEKTSYYLENAEARERLVRILPRAKFVFILREPVERAYSNWMRSRLNGLETLPFEEAIERELSRVSPLSSRSIASSKGNVSSRSEEHTSELQSRGHLVCRLLLEKKNQVIVA